MRLAITGSQTVGPYFSIGMADLCVNSVPASTGGDTVIVEGTVIDAEGRPIPDAVLELWQADVNGKYYEQAAQSPAGSLGFARISLETDGSFRFTTVKPGLVPYDGEIMQAPHIVVLIYMRGLLRHLVTRLYFPEESTNLTDPILKLVPAARRATLIARRGDTASSLLWDIVMRSDGSTSRAETVFFAC